MVEPPTSPLPFNRQDVFGLDLREHSSLSAYQWLTSDDSMDPGLIVIPVDADVVIALQEGEIQEAALAATDSLVAAGSNTPLAMCLRAPELPDNLESIASVAVESLIERYPDVIAYVFACDPERRPDWQEAIAVAMADINPRIAGADGTMLPVSAGALMALEDAADPGDVRLAAFLRTGASGYSIISLLVDGPVTTQLVQDSRAAIGETGHIALVLLRPATTVDAATIGAALQAAPIAPAQLLEGFTNSTSGAIQRQGEWQPARVGTVEYLRTTAPSASLTTEFIGTDLYLLGVRSPNAGRVHVWVDPPLEGALPPPDVTVDLETAQARDVAYPLHSGLSASRHRLVVITENQDGTNVMISGFFVAGQATPGWTGALVAVSLLAMAVAALTDRCIASIEAIRRSRGPSAVTREEHPRGFSRRH